MRRTLDMRRTLKLAALSVVALVAISSRPSAVLAASVTGVVVDSAGSPGAHALVDALPRENKAGVGTVGNRPTPWVQADENGRFSISLSPGRYKLHAKSELDGYPDPVYLLNQDPSAHFPEITVGRTDVAGVRVALGKRGGILEGEILDGESRNPIPGCKVRISDLDSAAAYVEVFADVSGHFRFAVPSKPLSISATAAGYESAVFEAGPVLLSNGERRSIVIELRR